MNKKLPGFLLLGLLTACDQASEVAIEEAPVEEVTAEEPAAEAAPAEEPVEETPAEEPVAEEATEADDDTKKD